MKRVRVDLDGFEGMDSQKRPCEPGTILSPGIFLYFGMIFVVVMDL